MSNGLGRGLGSLIPQKTQANNSNIGSGQSDSAVRKQIIPVVNTKLISSEGNEKDRVLKIPIEKIKVNPYQPRKYFSEAHIDELVESIKEYGIIQPLIVSKSDSGYELIAGERRLRASTKLGLKEVPAILREAHEQEKLEIALIENIQREDLNPIDLAHAYRRLIDEFNITQDAMAKRVSKSRPSITNTLRLLTLPDEIQTALVEGKITEGHAKYLVGLDTDVKQLNLFRKIMHNNLSVKETDNQARAMGGTKAARIKINYEDKDKEFALREFFGAKIEIKRKGKGGQIIIDFYSDEELREIISKVKKKP
jgi:ParB family chromosome partitioning protein